jgi:hypothetical protein
MKELMCRKRVSAPGSKENRQGADLLFEAVVAVVAMEGQGYAWRKTN